jgi:hypothetical protein
VVRVGWLSPTDETGLLGNEPEMLFVAIATRLGNRKDALVDTFARDVTGRSRRLLSSAFIRLQHVRSGLIR